MSRVPIFVFTIFVLTSIGIAGEDLLGLVGDKAARIESEGQGIEKTVSLKQQTLYRLSIKGSGTLETVVQIKPQGSDPAFGQLYKAWATGAAPLRKSEVPMVMEFVFDSGLKAHTA